MCFHDNDMYRLYVCLFVGSEENFVILFSYKKKKKNVVITCYVSDIIAVGQPYKYSGSMANNNNDYHFMFSRNIT